MPTGTSAGGLAHSPLQDPVLAWVSPRLLLMRPADQVPPGELLPLSPGLLEKMQDLYSHVSLGLPQETMHHH